MIINKLQHLEPGNQTPLEKDTQKAAALAMKRKKRKARNAAQLAAKSAPNSNMVTISDPNDGADPSAPNQNK